MIIGIDGNEANVTVKVGIGEYAFELLRQFKKFKDQNSKVTVYLKNAPNSDMPTTSDTWQYKVVKPDKLWTQIGLPINLFTQFPKPNIFFTPSHYAPRFSPVPTAISIMDVSYLRFPELFNKSDLYQLQNWTKYSVKNASAIFTISNSSKNDIIKYYHVEPKRVIVTYPGIKQESSSNSRTLSMEEIKNKYKIDGKFLLFVGTLQPRKNIVKLIEAFSEVQKSKNDISSLKNQNLYLVVVGKKGWQYDKILAAPDKYGVAQWVKFLDFVSDDDLSALYAHAECYVLPSLYEGFGLPVLEAMKHNCPVLTSNVSSLPEAGGEAALYFDPNDAHDIAASIRLVLKNTKLRSEMIEKGKKQIKKFSWEKTANETLEVLENLAKLK